MPFKFIRSELEDSRYVRIKLKLHVRHILCNMTLHARDIQNAKITFKGWLQGVF